MKLDTLVKKKLEEKLADVEMKYKVVCNSLEDIQQKHRDECDNLKTRIYDLNVLVKVMSKELALTLRPEQVLYYRD